MKPKLQVFFTGISAVAAASIAGLAYWGAFFTDIPETLIRQLRADVSKVKEEAVDLRRERRLLQEQAAKARNELDIVRMKVAAAKLNQIKLEVNLKKLREDLNSTTRKLDALDKERLAYLDQTLRIISADFTSKVGKKFKLLTDDARRAQQLPEFRSWVKQGKIYKRNNAIPSAWEEMYTTFWLQNQVNRNYADKMNRISRTTSYDDSKTKADTSADEEFLNNYQKRFMRGNITVPITGEQVFDIEWQRVNLNLLLKQDRNWLMNRYKKFVADHTTEFSRPLIVQFSAGWTDTEVARRADEVLANLERIRKLFPELKEYLVKRQ